MHLYFCFFVNSLVKMDLAFNSIHKNLKKGSSYHCDVESVKEVEGQSGNQVHEEPGGAVMEVNGSGVVHYLTRLAHIGGAEIQNNV